MARGVNRIILIGNLGMDPVVEFTTEGDTLAGFSLATNEYWKDREGRQQERTEWHRIVCEGRLGEQCEKELRRGNKIYVEGRLRTRILEHGDVRHHLTEVVAVDLVVLVGKQDKGVHYAPLD